MTLWTRLSAAPATAPDTVLKVLMEGNARWVNGRPRHPHQDPGRRRKMANGQQPPAIVVSCMDSRVPPELVFDQGVGDLLVVRTGAHVLDKVALGSIEFGVEEFGPRVILVLGHQHCGAVSSMVTGSAGHEKTFEGDHIQEIVDSIEPLYRQARERYGADVDTNDLVRYIVRAHTRVTSKYLASLPPMKSRIDNGQLIVVGGYYHLTGTGRLKAGAVELTFRSDVDIPDATTPNATTPNATTPNATTADATSVAGSGQDMPI